MNSSKIRSMKLPTVASLIILTIFGQCRSVFTINSVKIDNAITIDADLSDWKENISCSIKDIFDIGIANDDSSLYIGIKSNDPEAIHQVIRSGLTLWFKNDNPGRGPMGIRFPTGFGGSGKKLHHFNTDDQADSEGRISSEAFDVIEVLGPDKQDTVPMKLAIAKSFGLSLKTSLSPANFIYELRIPFHSDTENTDAAIPVITSSLLTIDIESPRVQFTGSGGNRFAENHSTGETFGSGQSSFPGYPGRPRNGMGNGGNQEPSEPFSIKLRVKLGN